MPETIFQLRISVGIDVTNPVMEEETLKAIGENAQALALALINKIKRGEEINKVSSKDRT